jgi:ATPase subunit of ABC transporter with duplicated ATPase domains
MSEQEANNLLRQFLFARDQVRTPVSRLSYGERRRLALARFVVQGKNLQLLDEPTNHLWSSFDGLRMAEPRRRVSGRFDGFAAGVG